MLKGRAPLRRGLPFSTLPLQPPSLFTFNQGGGGDYSLYFTKHSQIRNEREEPRQHRFYHFSSRAEIDENQWMEQENPSKLLMGTGGSREEPKRKPARVEKVLLPWDHFEAPDQNSKHYKHFLMELHYRASREEDDKWLHAFSTMGPMLAEIQKESLTSAKNMRDIFEDSVRFFCHFEEGAWDWSEELPFPPPTISDWQAQGETITPMQVVWMLEKYKRRAADPDVKKNEKEIKERMVSYVELLLETFLQEEQQHQQHNNNNNNNNKINSQDLEPETEFFDPDILKTDVFSLRRIQYGTRGWVLAKELGIGYHDFNDKVLTSTGFSKVWSLLIDRLHVSHVCSPDLLFRVIDATQERYIALSSHTWLKVFEICLNHKRYEEALRYFDYLNSSTTKRCIGRTNAQEHRSFVLDTCLNAGQVSAALRFFLQQKAQGYAWENSVYTKLVLALRSPEVTLEAVLDFIEGIKLANVSSNMLMKDLLYPVLLKSFDRGLEQRRNIGPDMIYHDADEPYDNIFATKAHALPNLADPLLQASLSESDSYLKKAVGIFQQLSQMKNIFAPSYGVALKAYAMLGDSANARSCYEQMVLRQIPRYPDHISALLAVLSRESDAQTVYQVCQRERLKGQHLSRAVDVMLKCGRVDFIEQTLNKYESAGSPTPEAVYRKIINACVLLGDEAAVTRFTHRMKQRKEHQMLTATKFGSEESNTPSQQRKQQWNGSKHQHSNYHYNGNRKHHREEEKEQEPASEIEVTQTLQKLEASWH